eukprot:2467354-Alexandrium_andersonii.AAC.1
MRSLVHRQLAIELHAEQGKARTTACPARENAHTTFAAVKGNSVCSAPAVQEPLAVAHLVERICVGTAELEYAKGSEVVRIRCVVEIRSPHSNRCVSKEGVPQWRTPSCCLIRSHIAHLDEVGT